MPSFASAGSDGLVESKGVLEIGEWLHDNGLDHLKAPFATQKQDGKSVFALVQMYRDNKIETVKYCESSLKLQSHDALALGQALNKLLGEGAQGGRGEAEEMEEIVELNHKLMQDLLTALYQQQSIVQTHAALQESASTVNKYNLIYNNTKTVQNDKYIYYYYDNNTGPPLGAHLRPGACRANGASRARCEARAGRRRTVQNAK
jgi:hypothetical protein